MVAGFISQSNDDAWFNRRESHVKTDCAGPAITSLFYAVWLTVYSYGEKLGGVVRWYLEHLG